MATSLGLGARAVPGGLLRARGQRVCRRAPTLALGLGGGVPKGLPPLVPLASEWRVGPARRAAVRRVRASDEGDDAAAAAAAAAAGGDEATDEAAPTTSSLSSSGVGGSAAVDEMMDMYRADEERRARGSESGASDAFPALLAAGQKDEEATAVQKFLFPPKEELPDDVDMSIWEHLEELRDRVLVAFIGVGICIAVCFAEAKPLVKLLEEPATSQAVRFLQLSPGEFFFTTIKVAGYSGLLAGAPLILYEIIAYVAPGLTRSEKKFLGPIVLGSSVLFYAGVLFAYVVLTPAALNFFVSFADGAVESLWSIDQYFEFVLVLLFSTGLAFQVPVLQLLLGGTGLVSGDQMLSVWRYVVVGAVVVAAVLTPSTDPLTQCLLAGPLIGLYMGGAGLVKVIEGGKKKAQV